MFLIFIITRVFDGFFSVCSRPGVPARTGDGAGRGPRRGGQGGVRGGGQPGGRRAVHVAVQQLAGNGRAGTRPVHGGRAAQHGRVHAAHAARLRHVDVLGEQRVRQTERAVRVPGDRRR